VETPEDEPVPEGLTKIHIPENQYWAFKYVGLHNPRKTTFRDFVHIYQAAEQWLPREAPRPYHFEKIDDDACDENYCELDLYYPVLDDRVSSYEANTMTAFHRFKSDCL
jgi:AraC family transcriptional regulator